MTSHVETTRTPENVASFRMAPPAVRDIDAQRIENDGHPISDAALRLVHQLFLANGEHAANVVVFAGMEHGNGCSKICDEVANILARDPLRSVCLVEANFRSPSVSGLSAANDTGGLAESLVRGGPIHSFAKSINSAGNLWRLPSGRIGADAATLLARGSLEQRIAELRVGFDFVVIDAPPLTLYADAVALGRFSDGTVLVIEAGTTRRDQASQVVTQLRASNIRVLGAVLNKRSEPIPTKLYDLL
jgi:Mrp family chromosome partitioning ATPase